ncbi:MAG: hypothetical protein H6722_03130 [Sandaracinus sp.]|nr:hypothetical protein [Sandaracinus sp.]MCB9621735.1 hypothetical protein [Sandaracinus sp.]
MIARSAFALSLLAIATPSPFSVVASAQPLLRVRAETRLELTQEVVPGGVRLRGALLDDLGVPLASREVVIELNDLAGGLRRERVRTDREGRFQLDVDLAESETARARALFGGDEGHERLEVERVVDGRRADVRLRLVLASSTLSLDEASHRIEAHADSSAGGSALELELLDELGRTLGRATTDAAGHAVFDVASTELGGPGAGRVVLRTNGDATRAPGRTETPIVRARGSTLTLEGPSRVAVGATAVMRGRLFDATGPLPERAVGFFAGERHLGSVLTRTDGTFEHPLEPTRDDAPTWAVVARYESDEPGHVATESPAVEIRVDVPAPTSLWALLALALCMVAAWLARSLWRREASAVTPPRPATMPLSLAKPRRAGERSRVIAGKLEDRESRGLAGRIVARSPEGNETLVPTDGDGRFEHELPVGTYELRFEAPGHATERVVVTLPHRGEWQGVTVRLESWRQRAWSVLRGAVERAGLPGWDRGTIREVVAPGDPSIRALGGAVEQAVYDRPAPDAAAIAELESKAERVPSRGSPVDRRAR